MAAVPFKDGVTGRPPVWVVGVVVPQSDGVVDGGG
jgi:hypothetical protein